jgi:hypothetical protein
MGTMLDVREMLTSDIERAFHQSAGKWTGCDWPTQFGKSGLNLYGLKAKQAALLARATSGLESADWRAAVEWLDQVERDAQAAQVMAGEALTCARNGNAAGALFHAQNACDLEAKYHKQSVWTPLRMAIAAALDAGQKMNDQG